MYSIRRRRFLASLLISPLGLSSLSTPFALAGIRRRTFVQDDNDLSAGFVVAWQRQMCCDGLIDFWTARASDIDTTMFPSCAQRVVLWDEVFSIRTVQRTVDEIQAVIPKYFGFDCRVVPNGFAFHAEGMNTVDQTLAYIFEANALDPKHARIALIDLDSCGVTALDWPQILPGIRGQYDLIVGVAQAVHRCPKPEEIRPLGCGASFVYQSSWKSMQNCDLSIVYSDPLLNYMSNSTGDRGGSLSHLISALAVALKNQGLIRRLSKRDNGQRATRPMFGISGLVTRLTDEDHLNEVGTQHKVLEEVFGPLSREQTVLMLDTGEDSGTVATVSLWPIQGNGTEL